MTRRVFTKCLNNEPKAFNFSIGSIVGGVSLLALFGFGKGLMWGIGFGAIGFTVGGWISKQWFLGNIQRKLYWHLPSSRLLIDKNCPESHHLKLM